MNLKIAAIIIACISCYSIVGTYRLFRRRKLSTRMFLFWSCLWLAIGFFALFPNLLDSIVQLVDMKIRISFLFFSSTILLLALIFHLSASLSDSNKKITKLAQEIAIIKNEFDNYKMFERLEE